MIVRIGIAVIIITSMLGFLAFADDSWLKASWSEKADLPYQAIDKEVIGAYRKAVDGDKQEFYLLAKQARAAFNKDENNPEKLYRAVMYDRYLIRIGKKLTKQDNVDFYRDAQHFHRIPSPNSYRYCRLAYIICLKFDSFKRYGRYYDKLLNRDPKDIDVIRVAAFAVLDDSTISPKDAANRCINYLNVIVNEGKAIATDYNLLGVAHVILYELTKDVTYLQDSLKYHKKALEVCPENYDNKKELIELVRIREKKLKQVLQGKA